jgi:hypothetical protein
MCRMMRLQRRPVIGTAAYRSRPKLLTRARVRGGETCSGGITIVKRCQARAVLSRRRPAVAGTVGKIILSIGYGKNSRGDLPYRFGPLLYDGGELGHSKKA